MPAKKRIPPKKERERSDKKTFADVPEKKAGHSRPASTGKRTRPVMPAIPILDIIRDLPDPTFVIDKRGAVIAWNRAMEEMTGISAADIIGKRNFEYALPFYGKRDPILIDIALNPGIDISPKYNNLCYERRIITATTKNARLRGKDVILWGKASPLLDGKGTIIGAIETIRDITEQKRAEEALHIAQEKYTKAFLLAPDAITISDLEFGRFIEVNDAVTKLFGFSRKELIGKSASELGIWLRKEDRDAFIEQVRTQGRVGQYEIVERCKSGELINVSMSADTMIIDNIKYLIAVIRDITDFKKAEKSMRESDLRYSALFSNNYSISLLIEPDTGMIVDTNDAAVRYYGYTREQLTKMGIYDLNRLDKKTVIKNLIRAKDEQAKHFFSTHYLANGEKRNVEIYSGPITVHGKPLFYSIIHDVSDRRNAEEALRESEMRYRTLIDQLPDYVIVHRDGILLYVNPTAARDLRFEGTDLIGKSIKEFIDTKYHEVVKNATLHRMAGEKVAPYEIVIKAKDGSTRYTLINGAQIVFEGKPAIMNVLTDISIQKAAEDFMQQAKETLEERVVERTRELTQANEQLAEEIKARNRAEQIIKQSLIEKDLLLREIHHRVKNNLQIIASLLNLQSRYITDPKVLDSIRDSQNRVRAMALVHERIYLSHDIATINLVEYLRFLITQIFRFYNIPQTQIEISVAIDDMPSDIDTAIPIGLIINELVSNALKHAFPEGRKGKITVKGTQIAPDQLQFVFRDDGIGMPADYDWTNTNSLGLRLVKSLTEQLLGTVEMVQDSGTVYTITVHSRNPIKGKETAEPHG